MKFPTLTITFLLFCFSAAAQHSINGYVRDKSSGENLIGVSIRDTRFKAGTISNSFGRYSLSVKTDSVNIEWSYVGYIRQSRSFLLKKDTTINILLDQGQVMLDETTISSTKAEDIQKSSSMSTFTIPIEQVKSLPTFFGERDLIKVLQLLPGVQGGNEGSSGLYVRGGGADQNLILLDGVPVYNASHLYGFFSTFNSDAINHVELVKGGFPARYGGRLSSVVDITMREGNKEKIKGRGTVGIISMKALLEGPVDKNSTFLFSARRSYLNLLKSNLIGKQADGVSDKYYMYDLNGRVNYKINKNNRIFLSAYNGGDAASSSMTSYTEDDEKRFDGLNHATQQWGNTLVAFRWNHVYGPKLFSNISTTYSKYHFNTATDITQISTDKISNKVDKRYYKYDYGSAIEDYAAKIDFDYVAGSKHYIRFGVGAINHKFSPGILAVTSTNTIDNGVYSSTEFGAKEGSAYVEDDIEVTSKLKVNAGVHASAFAVEEKTYSSIQPRFSGRYLLNEKYSIKASYAAMTQFVHLLTNAGVGLPTDLWLPSTGLIKPQNANQYALGAAGTYNNEYEISLEGYYKEMNNVIEYKDGATYLSANQNWQDKVEVGRGNSYGTELFIQKKIGRISGWIGYTLSWTNRQFDNLNNGKWFPYRYDRRHDIKITATWHVSKKFELGAVWVFATGNAVTVPYSSYYIYPDDNRNYDNFGTTFNTGYPLTYIPSRNNFRMRAYNRLDLSATYTIRQTKLSHEFNVSIYNAYARKNPYYLAFNTHIRNGQEERYLEQASLIGITPSISYSISF